MMKSLRANLRATGRAIAGLAVIPLVGGLTALQGFAVGPLTGNYSVIPTFLYKTMGKLFGYKISFNNAAAEIEKKRQVWYVANHMSISDFIVLGSSLKGTFAGKGEIMSWPVISQMARSVKYIGLRRSSDYNPESIGKINKNFNAGYNTIMFPEGTTTDGKKVSLLRKALLELLYGAKGVAEESWLRSSAKYLDKKLPNWLARPFGYALFALKEKPKVIIPLEKKDILVQPLAIRVLNVEGQNAIGNDELRNLYSMYYENNTLTRIWKRMQIRDIEIEVTPFPPMNPADYPDAKELINTAALQIAGVVNPGQTTFEKAVIPGQPVKPKQDMAPQ